MNNQIYTIKDPILREISESVDEKEIDEVVDNLTKVFKEIMSYGAGLSAVQIGILSRAIIMQDELAQEKETPLILINPKIDILNKGTLMHSYEGCLSIPGVFAYVQRPQSVTVSYLDEKNKKQKRIFSGQNAAVFLHEYDHLNGVWFIDRAFNRHYRREFERRNKVKLKTITDPYKY
jgi:peptide deformylase